MLAGDCLSFADDPPAFDCRCFVVPPSDVNNVFLWRQWDAFKNCVGAYAHWEVGRARGYKQVEREIHGLSVKERQEYIFQHLGVNVNDLPSAWRRGRCLRRVVFQAPIEEAVAPDVLAKLLAIGKATPGQVVTRSEYRVDAEIPLFNEDHAYVEDLLLDREEESAGV
jgi:tRNA(His) 5'-end guanylyltransferase